MNTTFNSMFFRISQKLEKHSILFLRVAIAFVYIWFGALKVIGLSPAEGLVEKTVFWFKPEIFVPVLGFAEVLIGLGFLFRKFLPYVIFIMLLHMAVTFVPFLVVPQDCFTQLPYEPTLIGQYIVKNVVLIAAAFVIAGNISNRKQPIST